MSRFTYIISEGVLDVVFLSEVLRHFLGFKQIEKLPDLPGKAKDFVGGFKWPVEDNIKRMAVPAPVFLIEGTNVVCLRNAEGIDKIKRMIIEDHERFLRLDWFPDGIGVILDSDAKPPQVRFDEFKDIFPIHGFPRPNKLAEIANHDLRRSGIYSFPGSDQTGTIEDLLLPIAQQRFAALSPHAAQYVSEWIPVDSTDFRELSKPSGRKKAVLSAMVALLKPGKTLSASIQDQNWLSDPQVLPMIQPLVDFLSPLLHRSISTNE